MLEITCNDRLGKKVRVKCNPDDTIGDLKKLIAAQTGTHWEKNCFKIRIALIHLKRGSSTVGRASKKVLYESKNRKTNIIRSTHKDQKKR